MLKYILTKIIVWLEQQNVWLLSSQNFFAVPTKFWFRQEKFCWINQFDWCKKKFVLGGYQSKIFLFYPNSFLMSVFIIRKSTEWNEMYVLLMGVETSAGKSRNTAKLDGKGWDEENRTCWPTATTSGLLVLHTTVLHRVSVTLSD